MICSVPARSTTTCSAGRSPASATSRTLPFLVFAYVDAALAVALFFRLPYVLWATLILCAFEFVRVAITFNKAPRDKHLDKEILITDGLVMVGAAYLLIVG